MIRVTHLTAEYQEQPIGIETQHVRFGWQTEAAVHSWRQAFYRIVVREIGGAVMWDSGKVPERRAENILYAGKCLESCGRYFFTVTVWGEDGSAASADSTFEMGLFDVHFTAAWIGHPHPRPGWGTYLRKNFTVAAGKTVAAGRAYFSGLGAGVLYLNGGRAGDGILEPLFTNYEKIIQYQAYDITAQLRSGENAVGVLLGSGWFHQNRVWDGIADYGPCRMRLELHIRYQDGTAECIISDETFVCDYSPVTLNNIYAGETYDARLEQEGWSCAGFAAEGWQPAVRMPSPGGKMVCRMMEPIRRTRTVRPVSVRRLHEGTGDQVWIYDMGENFAGFAHLRIPQSAAGTEYVLRYAEECDAAGNLDFNTTGIQHTCVVQQDRYIAAGTAGGEEWEPYFTYHGFRYVEVTGVYSRSLPENLITGVAVHTDLSAAGGFTCSDRRINRLQELTLRTILSNFHGFPEDCPIREKCGWLGDAQLVSETAICNFDMALAYEKYLEDIRTTKEVYGNWMMIAPGKRLCGEATPLWGSAQVILPWNLYLYYGDFSALERYYPLMREWVLYQKARSERLLVTYGLGDWCPPCGHESPLRLPVPVSSTAEFYRCSTLVSKAAGILGFTEDREQFLRLAAQIKQAFNTAFYNSDRHSYGTQGANGVALRYGLCPEGAEPAVAADLIRILREECGGAMVTGIYGNKHMVPAMTEYGYGAEMLSLLFNPLQPSFAAMMDSGATSLWECFQPHNDPKNAASLNHPMHGAFTNWFYSHILGIQPMEEAPGFREFVVRPYVFGGITAASGFRLTPYGRIDAAWEMEAGIFRISITVPANTTAYLFLPLCPSASSASASASAASCEPVRVLGSGQHTFTHAWSL